MDAATVELTELEKLEVTRVDAVTRPANGFPTLMMKGLPVAKAPMDADGDTDGPTHGAWDGTHTHEHAGPDGEMHSHGHSHDGDGDHGHEHAGKAAFDREAAKEAVKAIVGRKVDETPDIAGGTAVLSQIADLIIAEAQELKSGQAGEISDIQQLACAAEMIWCWRTGEEAAGSGSVMPATALMQSAGGCGCCDQCTAGEAAKADMSTASINDLPDSAFAYIEPGGEKDSGGKTTPRSLRHFPVHDEAHARNALSRAPQSPFGEKAMPKIKAAAKKFGIDTDTSKSAVAEGEAAVDTETQETGSQIAKAVEDAVAKATGPLKDELKLVRDELAKVKATPIPGGPHMSVVAPRPKAPDGEDWARKAAYYEEMADSVTQDPNAAAGYRQKAREAREKAAQSA